MFLRHGSESSEIGLHFDCDAKGGGYAINFVAEVAFKNAQHPQMRV